jgi:hypothetical protein
LEKGAYFASLKIVGKLAVVLDVEPGELLKVSARSLERLVWRSSSGPFFARGGQLYSLQSYDRQTGVPLFLTTR